MAKARDRRRENHEKKTIEEKEKELTRHWHEKASRILCHPKVQKPRAGIGFRCAEAVAGLSPHQKPWAIALEEREGQNATLISERYMAYDDDGVVLAAYYPQYLSATIVAKVSKVLLEFTNTYPPPTRWGRHHHTDWERLYEQCGSKKSAGLYHLCTWFEQGHLDKPPCLSNDTLPRKPQAFAAVPTLIESLKLLTFCLSLLYRVLNRKSWDKSINVVSKVCKRNPSSRIVRSGKWDAWTGRVILANALTHAHRHLRDSPEALTAIACFGSFSGGEVVLPNLRVKFPCQPGDVIFINSHLLEHFVTKWEPSNLPDGRKGGRHSIVHFNHKDIVEWAMGDDSSLP